MNYQIAMRSAFSRGDEGGNPAGILICDVLPTPEQMLAIAAEVGAAETVFAQPTDSATGKSNWRVRYYSPEQEVPFCGHATVALTAELNARSGQVDFQFSLSQQDISVSFVQQKFALIHAPKPSHTLIDAELQRTVLDIFHLQLSDLVRPRIVLVNAGSNHLAIELTSREDLAAMNYDFAAARELMQRLQIATVALYYRASPLQIIIRNAFAFGGVYEDPATGSGAAAVTGFLQATSAEYKPADTIEFRQGDDMGQPCTLLTQLPDVPGQSIKLIGESRSLPDKFVTVN